MKYHFKICASRRLFDNTISDALSIRRIAMKNERNRVQIKTTLRLAEGILIAARHQALTERITLRELAEKALDKYLKTNAGKGGRK
jgi:hypothetical protein